MANRKDIGTCYKDSSMSIGFFEFYGIIEKNGKLGNMNTEEHYRFMTIRKEKDAV